MAESRLFEMGLRERGARMFSDRKDLKIFMRYLNLRASELSEKARKMKKEAAQGAALSAAPEEREDKNRPLQAAQGQERASGKESRPPPTAESRMMRSGKFMAFEGNGQHGIAPETLMGDTARRRIWARPRLPDAACGR